MTRSKRARRRPIKSVAAKLLPLTPEQKTRHRARVGWHMSVGDLLIGYYVLGVDYPMNGDDRP